MTLKFKEGQPPRRRWPPSRACEVQEPENDADSDGSSYDGAFAKLGAPASLTAFSSRRGIQVDEAADQHDLTSINNQEPSRKEALVKFVIGTHNACAIDDDDDEEEEHDPGVGPSNQHQQPNEEGAWEEASDSYNADGSATINTAVAIRRSQLFLQRFRRLVRLARMPRPLAIGGSPQRYARDADGKPISNLTRQLDRHAQLADIVAASRSPYVMNAEEDSNPEGIVSLDISELGSYLASPSLARTHDLPDPLRCHRGPPTPPDTPPTMQDAQSPVPPPPAPPSTPSETSQPFTPYMPFSRRPSRFGSNTRLQDLLTPPMTPTIAITTMANAFATEFSSGSSPSTSIFSILKKASPKNAPVTPVPLRRAPPELPAPIVIPEPSVIHINQVGGSHPTISSSTVRTGINPDGHEQHIVPYNGARGPRAEPFVRINTHIASQSSFLQPGTSNGGPCIERSIIRPARSGLIGSELTDEIQRSLLIENSVLGMYNIFGTRRFFDVPLSPTWKMRNLDEDSDEDHEDQDQEDITVQEGQETQEGQANNEEQEEDEDDEYPSPARSLLIEIDEETPLLPKNNIHDPLSLPDVAKAKPFKHGPFQPLTRRQVYFVDDYEEPEDWSFGDDYHSRGW